MPVFRVAKSGSGYSVSEVRGGGCLLWLAGVVILLVSFAAVVLYLGVETTPEDVVEIRAQVSSNGTWRWFPARVSASPEVRALSVVHHEFQNGVQHTFVVPELGISEQVAAGDEVEVDLPNRAGRFAFYCETHPQTMRGTIIIP